jgi:hypothetical protein
MIGTHQTYTRTMSRTCFEGEVHGSCCKFSFAALALAAARQYRSVSARASVCR